MSSRHPIPPTRWPEAAEARSSLLFEPISVGAFTSRTRTWVPAMVPWRSVDEGFVTEDILNWYGRFADGRPGVLVVEATGIRDVPSGPLLRIGHERFLPGLRQLVEVVRRRSEQQTRLVIQIIDFLRIRRRPPKERYLREFLKLRDAHVTQLAGLPGMQSMEKAPEAEVREALLGLDHERLLTLLNPREREALETGAREYVTDLPLPHIRELPEVLPGLFAAAARRAREAGLDGVELHFAHAYTMASFLSRRNDREDGYGGSRENRLRLPLEVYRAVRAEVGDDFTVGCRILSDEVIEGGSRVDDACFYAARLAEAGMDYLSISKGGKFEDAKQPRVGEAAYPYTGKSGHECMPTVHVEGAPPFGRNLPACHAIRNAVREALDEPTGTVSCPIVAAGGINSFELAEAALQNGDADLIGAARQSLADPDWWLKIEQGKGEQVRRCIYTNYCEALDQKHKQVTCQLWDQLLQEPDASTEDGSVTMSRDRKRRLVPPPWVTAE